MTLPRDDPTTHKITPKFDEPIRANIATGVITWDEVSQYVQNKELYKLRRSQAETDKYHKHKKNLEIQHISILQYILNKLSWNEKELDQLNDLQFATDEQKINAVFTKPDLFKTSMNDFPYYYEPNIMHLLVWSKLRLPIYLNDTTEIDMFETEKNQFPDLNPPCKAVIDKFLDQTLHDKYGLIPGKDYIWFVNYSNLQSIKAISHVHVLIKWKTEQEKLKMIDILTKDGEFKPITH
ncbi:N-acetylglucosamine-induced protein 1 [Monosporozyma servazzii]